MSWCLSHSFSIYFIGAKSQDKRVFMGLHGCSDHTAVLFCYISSPMCLLYVSYRCVHSYSPGSCIDFRTILQDLARTVDQSSRRRSKKVESVRNTLATVFPSQGSCFPSMISKLFAKHRIPPSPKGSRFSLNVTGCVSHWLEWQSKVYLSHLVSQI